MTTPLKELQDYRQSYAANWAADSAAHDAAGDYAWMAQHLMGHLRILCTGPA
jgi:hypothetical protein